MTMTQTGHVPAWSLADRLRKAREVAGFTQQELADQIGVARKSVANYEAARTRPRMPVLFSWAAVCGVDFEWLAGSPHPGLSNVGHRTRGRKSPICTVRRALLPAVA